MHQKENKKRQFWICCHILLANYQACPYLQSAFNQYIGLYRVKPLSSLLTSSLVSSSSSFGLVKYKHREYYNLAGSVSTSLAIHSNPLPVSVGHCRVPHATGCSDIGRNAGFTHHCDNRTLTLSVNVYDLQLTGFPFSLWLCHI